MSVRFSNSENYESVDQRMIALMRFILAFSALVIIFIDPSEPNRLVLETYFALVLYTIYSAFILIALLRGKSFIDPVLKISHWIDIVWYLVIIALSSGTSSIYFFFFFFVILHTSFSYGFSVGLKVTLVSAAAFTIVGYATSPSGANFELNRFLLRPVYLTVLGYMMAYWGGYEIRTRRRLALLREIVSLSNPRFGVDRTIGEIICLLRDFYSADGALLITINRETGERIFRRADRNLPDVSAQKENVSSGLVSGFLSLPENCAAIYGKRGIFPARERKLYHAVDLKKSDLPPDIEQLFLTIAERLDAGSYLTVPVYYQREPVGRIFIYAREKNVFEPSDIDFLLQAINQFMPIIENIRLVDRLALSAAEEERKKIARDIHDSIIQPYIGLQFGIDSVVQLFDDEEISQLDDRKRNELFKQRINRLKNLTQRGIEDLRGYIQGLSKPRGLEVCLLPAIERYAERFTKTTGISATVEMDENIQIPDRLAAELFQIVAEGLSNIRRHTSSRQARIALTCRENFVILAIENNCDNNNGIQFKPRSISERARSLGGFLEVEHNAGKTVVRIEIPL